MNKTAHPSIPQHRVPTSSGPAPPHGAAPPSTAIKTHQIITGLNNTNHRSSYTKKTTFVLYSRTHRPQKNVTISANKQTSALAAHKKKTTICPNKHGYTKRPINMPLMHQWPQPDGKRQQQNSTRFGISAATNPGLVPSFTSGRRSSPSREKPRKINVTTNPTVRISRTADSVLLDIPLH